MEDLNIKHVAIEFAKYLTTRSIRKHTSCEEHVDYIPKEFKLLRGELIVNGEVLFDEWIGELLNTTEQRNG